MSKPLPEQTSAGPAYEGRLLPDPSEEVVDQGLSFDIATLFSRRRMMALLGIGTSITALAACAPTSESTPTSSATDASTGGTGLTEIPEETNGPYPADGSNGPDILEQSGIIRSDIRSSFGDSTTTAEGIALTLEFTVIDLAGDGAPMEGVAVYAWQCDRAGNYSMYSEAIVNENYLRGVQIADAEGVVAFTSIFPACYTGRWPHIHFEVYPNEASITDYDARIATSQMALPKDACDLVFATAGYEQSVRNLSQLTLESDNVFGDDAGAQQLATITGSVEQGYRAALQVPIDTSTEPAASGGGGEPPAGGGSGGPGGAPPAGDGSGRPSGPPTDES